MVLGICITGTYSWISKLCGHTILKHSRSKKEALLQRLWKTSKFLYSLFNFTLHLQQDDVSPLCFIFKALWTWLSDFHLMLFSLAKYRNYLSHLVYLASSLPLPKHYGRSSPFYSLFNPPQPTGPTTCCISSSLNTLPPYLLLITYATGFVINFIKSCGSYIASSYIPNIHLRSIDWGVTKCHTVHIESSCLLGTTVLGGVTKEQLYNCHSNPYLLSWPLPKQRTLEVNLLY